MSGTTVETAIRVVSRWLRDEVVEDRVAGWSCGTGTPCAAWRRPHHHDAHGGAACFTR